MISRLAPKSKLSVACLIGRAMLIGGVVGFVGGIVAAGSVVALPFIMISPLLVIGGGAILFATFCLRGERLPLALRVVLVVLAVLFASGFLGAITGVVRSLGAVGGERIDPSQKARVLAEGISETANCTALLVLVMLIGAVVALVYRFAKGRRAKGPLNSAIGLRDSRVAAVRIEHNDLVLDMEACVHVSEGSPGHDRGEVWSRPARIRVRDATRTGSFDGQYLLITDGAVRIDTRTLYGIGPDIVPLALDETGAVEVEISGHEGTLKVTGTGLRIEVTGEGQCVEKFRGVPTRRGA